MHVIELEEMMNIFMSLKTGLLFPLVACFFLVYFLRSVRWKLIVSCVQRITVFESFNLCMPNYLINFLVPIHAGELAKSLLLKKMKGTPVAKSLPTVYVDKIIELVPFFLLLILTPFLAKQVSKIIYLVSLVLFLLLLFLALCLYLFVMRKDMALNWFQKMFFFLPNRVQENLADFLRRFVDGLSDMTNLSDKLLEISLLTLLAVALHCAYMWLFFYAFGIKLSATTVVVGYLLLNISFLLPAPPGFAGSLELTFLFIFSYIYGYDKNVISAIAASSHIFMGALFGITGTLSMFLIGANLSNVLGMGRTDIRSNDMPAGNYDDSC